MFDSPKSIPMPQQKVADSKKTEQWLKDCIDACESLILSNSSYSRESRRRKQINYDLYAGKLHPSDAEMITNPMGLKDIAFPAKAENHPLCNPYIKALIGEEIKRRFDFSLKVENEEAISEKEKAKGLEYFNVIDQFLKGDLKSPDEQGMNPNSPEYQQASQEYQQELEKRLEQKTKYINYSWQDIRELSGTRLLNYYSEKLELSWKFTQGYEDALISTEEIYSIDIYNNEPSVRRCNPLNTHFMLPPDSYKIEDSEIIVEENYIPISAVLDRFYDYLTPDDIDYLEEHVGYKNKGMYGQIPNYELSDPTFALPLTDLNNMGVQTSNAYLPFDAYNNVRVVKTVWLSMRKIGILTYYDEQGNQQTTQVPETYKVDITQGESVVWKWIGEWYEGTKIANHIYIKMQPRPLQFRTLNNLSTCSSGYVGTVYKTNSSQPQSLIDLIKPYQYMYNIMYHKFKLLIANNIGKVMKMDLAHVPDGWEPDKWLYYAKVMNVAVVDSFKEAKKGSATGKLAGQSTQSDVIDLELGTSIQQMINIMENIKRELDLITGISPERRGERTSSDQGLGVSQQNLAASSNITEWYFKLHDNTKIRVLAALLETAKYCLRQGNKTIQYIEDDMTSKIFEIDGELINESEYGIVLRDAVADREALQMLRQATEIALQTGQVDVIQLMDIYSNQSLSSIRRKIEQHIENNKKEKQQEQEAEQKHEKEVEQMNLQTQQDEINKKYELEYAKLDADNFNKEADRQVKIEIEQMKAYAFDEGPATEDITIAADKALQEEEHRHKGLIENQKIQSKERLESNKQAIDRLKLKQEKELKYAELNVAKENMKNDIAVAKINAKNRANKK